MAKRIPASGEELPAIGIGTWQTFDVRPDPVERAPLREVLKAFAKAGGRVVDSSPMYGAAEAVVGDLTSELGLRERLFMATKVWTRGRDQGIRQMEASFRRMRVQRMDLMQVHNLMDVAVHTPTLKEMKAKERIRYIGMTTSHGSRHEEMAAIMTGQPIDFVQFTYNILDREAEARLLPLAAERGLGVIVNRPFQGGSLFDSIARHPLPDWAAEIDCANWAQVFLKFAVSHPAVTCAIPATSRVDHMQENMGAGYGRLPDAAMRARMIRHVESL